jgi:tetratricopeptide (TPR) repeat protein
MIKRGIIVRDLFEMPIDEIENSQVGETVIGRLLGYNRITLEDVDGPKKHLNLIREGHEFHGRVLEQISMGRTWREQYYNPPAPRNVYAPTPPPDERRNRGPVPMPPANQSRPQEHRQNPPRMNAVPLQLPSAAPALNPTQQLNRAIALLQQNQKAQAREVLKALLEQDERNADAWYLMGLTIAEPTRRRAAFMKALRINPNHAQARQALQ